MNRKLMVVTAIILTLGLAISGCLDTSGPAVPQVGDPAPDFQLQDLDGNTISLSGLRGSPVMLNFWATWCGYCVEEMPLIEEVYQGWAGKPPSVVILAIDVKESLSKVRSFMEDYNLSFPALLDSDGSVAEKYGVRAIPTSFFIDKDGIVQDVKIGSFQSVAEIEDSLRKVVP
jgi:peroxiredoxin